MGVLAKAYTVPAPTTASPYRLGKPNKDPVHPLGDRARVLLSSVFGPYAQDDEFGGRKINPMELYHNQVTREQGPFSLRMFHRSWGIMMIQANINAPCTLLDFPDQERFIHQITTNTYDIVGISSIVSNVGKVERMCQLVREHLPNATIVIGGHVAGMSDLQDRIDADHIVRGDGIRWMRRFLGEDDLRPVIHPKIISGVSPRAFGIPLSTDPGDVAATLIPSVGCPMGCNFCSTSAMFGGKGRYVHFYKTGEALFEVMQELEREMKIRTFFVMDENFLLHRKRALRLLDLMVEHDKSWSLYVFSSANVLRMYTMDQLVALGVSWVWMGLEGEHTSYAKLKGANTKELVRTLQSHGIHIVGSTIIGLENHTPDNIHAAIEHAVSHDTEFHQFMLYTAVPGTPLHAEQQAAGTLLDPSECSDADAHGQLKFNFHHPHFDNGEETSLLRQAFLRDFEINGPSVIRVVRTILTGWRRYKDHADHRIRNRFRWEARSLATAHAGAAWAARKWFRSNPAVSERISRILKEIYRECGLKARLAAPAIGRYLYYTLNREAQLLDNGRTYEPPTFCEANANSIVKTAGVIA